MYVVITKHQRFRCLTKSEAQSIASAFYANGKWAFVSGPWKRKHR